MTDEELVKRLRDFDPHIHEWEVVDEAADRIEGLEENQRFIIRERDRTFALMLARAEKAEAERDNAWAMVARADTQMGQSLADHLQAKADNARLRAAILFWLEAQEPDVDAAIALMHTALKGETT